MRLTIIISILIFSVGAQAVGLQCKAIFAEKGTSNRDLFSLFTKNLEIPLAEVRTKLTEADQLQSPIKITGEMQNFREAALPLMKLGGNVRESFVRWMEAQLRAKSLQRKQGFGRRKTAEYDLVIVGTGVHGITALHEVMSVNPSLRVLIVDKNDTAGATFRKAGATFNINSSNRASGEGRDPLPGRGNINELPGSPIQVSDVTNVKYPSALDLGDTLVTSLYAAVSRYKNVDIAYGTQVKGIEYAEGKDFSNTIFVEGAGITKGFKIKSQGTIFASGLGKPNIPREIRALLNRDRQLTALPKGPYKLPRVITFEDVLQMLQKSSDPKRFFADKKIAVVGTGDSANVFIEFLLGYATKEGYSLSDAQTPNAQKIYWLGQCRTTCEAFIADARSRYAPIGTGYRSSDPATEALIEAIPARLDGVKKVARKGVIAEAEGQRLEVDTIVLTTGYSNRLVEILKDLVADKINSNKVTTAEFFENYGGFLEAVTSVSNGQPVRVAKSFADGKVLVVGPSAGKLPRDSELVGIIQNSVSIFNNAPRSQAAAGELASSISPKASNPLVLDGTNKARLDKRLFEIKDIATTRLLGESTEAHLKQVLLSALELTGTRPQGKSGPYHFTVSKVQGGLEVSSSNGFPGLRGLHLSLLEMGVFYRTINEVFRVSETSEVTIQVDFKYGKLDLGKIELDFH